MHHLLCTFKIRCMLSYCWTAYNLACFQLFYTELMMDRTHEDLV